MKNFLSVVVFALLVSCGNEDKTKGDDLFSDKEYKEAIIAYSEYLDLHPTHVKSLYNRGRSYEELKEYNKAFTDFKEVLENDKKNTSAMLSLSKHYYRIENFEQSLYHAQTAVKLKDDLAEAHFWVGRASHHMGDFLVALDAYKNAINLDKQYGEAYLYRGAIYMGQEKKSAGCRDFQKAKSLGVKEAEAAVKKYCN